MKRIKKLAVLFVLAVGTLTTVATSRAPDPMAYTSTTLSLEEGSTTYVLATYDEVTMDHARRHADVTTLSVSFFASSGVVFTVVPDDAAFPAQTASSMSFTSGIDACPDSGACTLGFTIEAQAGTDVQANANATTTADGSLLFGQNRDYPEGATVTVAIEE